MRDFYCFCGVEQVGHKRCSDGNRCPRQAVGQGHWHVALPQLESMPTAERTRRYPGLRLRSLARHVAEQGLKKQGRKHGRHPHVSTRRVWRRSRTSSSRSRKCERHPHASGCASASSLFGPDRLREVFGPKADAAEKPRPTFLEPESKQMLRRV